MKIGLFKKCGSEHELLIVQASPLVQTLLAADLTADGDGGVLEAVDGEGGGGDRGDDGVIPPVVVGVVRQVSGEQELDSQKKTMQEKTMKGRSKC